MNLYLIRHGRQNSTLCNVNVPLSEEGRMQASLLGKRLSHYEIDGLVSSNLIRARETAEIIKEELEKASDGISLEHIIERDLREIEYGDLEGIENEQVKIDYKEYFAARDKMNQDVRIPGGECGMDVYERAMKVLIKLTEMGKENVAIVSHGGTIRSILAGVLGMEQGKRFLLGKSLENTSVTHLKYDETTGRFYVERFNDYAHLEDHPKLLRKYFK